MSRSPKRPRALRREQQRALSKLGEQAEKLARLEAGGTPEHPRVLDSAAQVESAAEREPCLTCGGQMQAETHDAVTRSGRRLRVATTKCRSCGRRRTWYFQLRETLLS